MADIVMPRLSDTMEEGTILRWLKHDGEEIQRGSELVEIETDKATMVYESDQDGVLRTLAKEGDTLAVGELIARVGAEGVHEAAREADAVGDDGASGGGAAVGNAAQRPAGAIASAAPAPGGPTDTAPERIRASPLAKRIARDSGVDLRALTGSGPGGRIVKADVQAAGPEPSSAPSPPSPGLEGVLTAKGEVTVVELSRTQQTIARRMAESKATIPDFTLQAEVDMELCVALRAELKGLVAQQPASRQEKTLAADGAPGAAHPDPAEATPTYNDMVVKASALALREHPRANGSYRDGHLQLHSRVNVGVAVASETPAGGALVVPTVFDADLKSLGEIARETRALAARVREGTITPPELSGGTFTVSNLGMYGVRNFTAIINPPQAAILSVGTLEPRAVVRGAEVLARHTMMLTLACDHRILYGADAALLLARIRELLEAPTALTL